MVAGLCQLWRGRAIESRTATFDHGVAGYPSPRAETHAAGVLNAAGEFRALWGCSGHGGGGGGRTAAGGGWLSSLGGATSPRLRLIFPTVWW